VAHLWPRFGPPVAPLAFDRPHSTVGAVAHQRGVEHGYEAGGAPRRSIIAARHAMLGAGAGRVGTRSGASGRADRCAALRAGGCRRANSRRAPSSRRSALQTVRPRAAAMRCQVTLPMLQRGLTPRTTGPPSRRAQVDPMRSLDCRMLRKLRCVCATGVSGANIKRATCSPTSCPPCRSRHPRLRPSRCVLHLPTRQRAKLSACVYRRCDQVDSPT